METIHLKSVDPLSQELLRSAARRGIKLSWERYERQQPQDGFIRLGLSCPVGCLQGPCRIDPFRRGAEKGICGLDGDGMVAAFLLRLIQQGLLETLAGQESSWAGEIAWPAALAELGASAVQHLDGGPLSLFEIPETAGLLQMPNADPEYLLKKALRLGLMAVALRGRATLVPVPERGLSLQVGYGLLGGGQINIGVAGYPPREQMRSLLENVKPDAASPVQVVSLGDWISGQGSYLPFVCTSGEAELAVCSGNIHFLLAGPDADPALIELCRSLEVPFLLARHAAAGNAGEILSLACARGRSTGASLAIDPALTAAGSILPFPGGTKAMDAGKKLALVGGSDDVRQSLGYLPVELAFALRGQEFTVGAWGDAALWMIKNGFAATDQENPALILDQDAGPLTLIAALAAVGKLEKLGGICLTGLKNCADLAFALGLSALGTNVCLAIPLPLWGSEPMRSLLAKILAGQGGALTHFDHPASLPEILSWFSAA